MQPNSAISISNVKTQLSEMTRSQLEGTIVNIALRNCTVVMEELKTARHQIKTVGSIQEVKPTVYNYGTIYNS